MRVYIKRFLCIASIILVVFVYVLLSGEWLFYRQSDVQPRMDGFYLEDKNTIDVALVGSSEVYNDFNSPLAYEKYGFTSYPIGTPGQNGFFLKYQIEEILQYQTPKLFVIEVNGFLGDDTISDAQIRFVSENMKISANKISLLNEVECKDDLYTYYFPFFKYHNDTSVASGLYAFKNRFSLFQNGYSLLKGNYTGVYCTAPQNAINTIGSQERAELTEKNKSRLLDLINYVKDKSLNVLFVRFPRITTETRIESMGRSNTAGDIIRENGFNYLNFVTEIDSSVILNENDYYNSEHLNVIGQKKFTEFFGGILVEKYGITPTELNEIEKEKWDYCIRFTHSYIKLAIKETEQNNSNEEKYLYEELATIKKINENRE
jgi:hypothetical protein